MVALGAYESHRLLTTRRVGPPLRGDGPKLRSPHGRLRVCSRVALCQGFASQHRHFVPVQRRLCLPCLPCRRQAWQAWLSFGCTDDPLRGAKGKGYAPVAYATGPGKGNPNLRTTQSLEVPVLPKGTLGPTQYGGLWV